MGSFKLRLLAYFLVLSLVPLLAAAWAFSEVATRGELAHSDARLNAALRVAVRGSSAVMTTGGGLLGRIVVWIPLDDDLLADLRANAGLEPGDSLLLALGGRIV